MRDFNISQIEEIIKELNQLIQEQDATEFNIRDSGLSLRTFLYVFTISICFMKRVTLEGLSIKCQELQYGLSLSKQALHQSLNKGAKALQMLLASAIVTTMLHKTYNPSTAAVFEQFDAVLITDATILSLPDKLAEYHKGLGGKNAKSAMKIQATYDVKSKTFRKISQRDSARENDAKYMKELIKEIKPNELSITDLGYYGIANFMEIAKKGAYFISKIKSNTIIYKDEDKPMNIVRELKRKDFIDKMVIIKGDNGKKSMEVRLCGIKLPSDVYTQRIRKANKKAKSSGKTLSKEEIERLKWILIVTNVSSEMLDYKAVCEIYRIRWQIELIFKSWKSHFSIDEMNNVGKDYWDCLLYGKLIVITMLTALYSQIYHLIFQTTRREISFLRFMKNIRENLDVILDYMTFQISGEQMVLFLERVIRASLLEKRRRKTSEQAIADFDLPGDTVDILSDFAA